MDKLTIEQIEQTAAELSEKYKAKIVPIVLERKPTGEQVVGYMKEPDRVTKMMIIDKGASSPMMAGQQLLQICLLVADSDPRFTSEAPENDDIYIGAVTAAMSTIEMATIAYKKK